MLKEGLRGAAGYPGCLKLATELKGRRFAEKVFSPSPALSAIVTGRVRSLAYKNRASPEKVKIF